MKWQPIETAPKTGIPKDILLFVPAESGTGRVVVAHWAHGGGEEQPRFGPAWFFWMGYGFDELRNPPSLWMPIPDPRAEPIEEPHTERRHTAFCRANANVPDCRCEAQEPPRCRAWKRIDPEDCSCYCHQEGCGQVGECGSLLPCSTHPEGR